MGVALCLSACAGLPKNVDRPVSHALESPAGTPLATLARQRDDAAHARYDSGFMLLDGSPAAYGSRLALVQAAQKTLDLQYYSIHADPSTAQLLSAVREAAARGVRVRILLDDLHSTGKDAAVMEMAFVPNVEMRMFNPLAGARASGIGRMLASIDDASRIQQRMHNKLFIADNVMAVSGGRNLGDAYFGKASDGNFVYLDVLTAGPVVKDLSRSFDAYWNNERAYPVQSLVSKEELDGLREQAREAVAAEREKQAPADGEPGPALSVAEHRDRAADPQRPPVREREREDRPGDGTRRLARRAAGRPSGLARARGQRPRRCDARPGHQRSAAADAEGDRAAGAGQAAVSCSPASLISSHRAPARTRARTPRPARSRN